MVQRVHRQPSRSTVPRASSSTVLPSDGAASLDSEALLERFLDTTATRPRASWDHHHMKLPAYLRGGVPLDWIVNIQQSHLETYERVPGQTSRAAQHYYRVGNDLQSRPSASTQQVTTYASTARRIAAVFTGASRQRSPTVVRSSSEAGRVSVILDRRPFSCRGLRWRA